MKYCRLKMSKRNDYNPTSTYTNKYILIILQKQFGLFKNKTSLCARLSLNST